MDLQRLEQWNKELSKCIRCGTCRQFCPIHQVLDDERYTARGKLHLVEQYTEQKWQLTEGLMEMLHKCVMCKACTANCPSNVDTYKIFLEMRQEIVGEKGLSFTKQAIFRALSWRKLFDLGLRTGALFQRMVFKSAADGHGQVARIPLPMAGFNQRRIIPNLPPKHLKAILPEKSSPEQQHYRVGFFTGCMLNYVYPQVGLDLVDILLLHGVEVITPHAQHCCGTPLFTSGETDIARAMIKHNVHLFAALEVDYIITGCGSCGLAWKTEFPHLLGEEDEDYPLALALARKARDISEFLQEFGLRQDLLQELPRKITYHDSCHLNRGQKIRQQPRQLLQAIPGVEYREMEEADSCCGSGGSFNLKYYALSRQINQQKTCHIAQSGADIVAVGCPACLMHIADGLQQDEIAVETKHLVTILAESYGLHQTARR